MSNRTIRFRYTFFFVSFCVRVAQSIPPSISVRYAIYNNNNAQCREYWCNTYTNHVRDTKDIRMQSRVFVCVCCLWSVRCDCDAGDICDGGWCCDRQTEATSVPYAPHQTIAIADDVAKDFPNSIFLTTLLWHYKHHTHIYYYVTEYSESHRDAHSIATQHTHTHTHGHTVSESGRKQA